LKRFSRLKQRIQAQPNGRPPGLAVLMVGDNPTSAAYVLRGKDDAVGIASFGASASQLMHHAELNEVIKVTKSRWWMEFWWLLYLQTHLDAVSLLPSKLIRQDAG